jgi:hypothetical protein
MEGLDFLLEALAELLEALAELLEVSVAEVLQI